MLVSHGIIYRYVGRSSWYVIDFEENIKWKVEKILIKTGLLIYCKVQNTTSINGCRLVKLFRFILRQCTVGTSLQNMMMCFYSSNTVMSLYLRRLRCYTCRRWGHVSGWLPGQTVQPGGEGDHPLLSGDQYPLLLLCADLPDQL